MLNYLLNGVITLFVTVDPIGLGPMFVTLTMGLTAADRRVIARRATITAAAVLVLFALAGSHLLAFLGISLAAFRVAGGLLLFWLAFEMVFDRRQTRKSATIEPLSADDISHLSVVPLAIPLISGPGSISATILLASHAQDWLWLAGLIGVIVLLMAVVFAVFQAASTIDRLLGATGRAVTSRLLGVILAALAVQFVADGVMVFARG